MGVARVVTRGLERVMAQWCNPLTLKAEQSDGVGSIPGKTPTLEGNDKGSQTQLGRLYFCSIFGLALKNTTSPSPSHGAWKDIYYSMHLSLFSVFLKENSMPADPLAF